MEGQKTYAKPTPNRKFRQVRIRADKKHAKRDGRQNSLQNSHMGEFSTADQALAERAKKAVTPLMQQYLCRASIGIDGGALKNLRQNLR